MSLFGDAADIDAVIEVLSLDAIAFLRLDEALDLRWADTKRCYEYVCGFFRIFEATAAKIKAASERGKLDEATRML